MVMVMVMLNQVQVFHDRLTYTVVITNNSGQGENTFYCIILCSFSGPLLSIKYQKTEVILCTVHSTHSAICTFFGTEAFKRFFRAELKINTEL